MTMPSLCDIVVIGGGPATPARRFPALFDRGCLPGMAGGDRLAYVQQAAALPGAHFLWLHKTRGNSNDRPSPAEQAKRNQQTFNQLQRALQATFAINKMQPTLLTRTAIAHPQAPVPALALWPVRR